MPSPSVSQPTGSSRIDPPSKGARAGNRPTGHAKRWRNAEMALRWTAAGMMEAQKTFRRLKAYRQLPILR